MNVICALLHCVGVCISRDTCGLLLIPFVLQGFNLVVGCERQEMVLVIKFGNGRNRISGNLVEVAYQLFSGDTSCVAGLNNGSSNTFERVTSHFTG